VDLIPKDIVICDWHYARADQTAVYFAMKGFDVVSCFWKNPEVAAAQVRDMMRFRESSTPQMRQHFRGVVQTIWSGTGASSTNFTNASPPTDVKKPGHHGSLIASSAPSRKSPISNELQWTTLQKGKLLHAMNRRRFLQTATPRNHCIGWLAAAHPPPPLKKIDWPIGCFNRPWVKMETTTTPSDGIAAAGYKLTGLLTVQKGEAFTSSSATPIYLDGLKKRIAQRGLVANMTAIRFKADGALADNIADFAQTNRKRGTVGIEVHAHVWRGQAEHYENFYRLMADAAAQTDKHGIRLVMKPHGGGSGAVRGDSALPRQSRLTPTSRSGTTPATSSTTPARTQLAELEPIAKHVTGLCAKDCPAPRAK
jgi:hypothetical protein